MVGHTRETAGQDPGAFPVQGDPTLADNSSGRSTIIAAIILGLAAIAASFVIKSSLDQGAAQLQLALKELDASLAKVANSDSRRPTAARPSRPGRPDPNKQYAVAVGKAPTKGPKTAPIQIVEWSDFQ
jgi:protein-disulfide isomerase